LIAVQTIVAVQTTLLGSTAGSGQHVVAQSPYDYP
jgi:hypothetical protein